MKKSLRLVLAAAILMTVAPTSMFAAVGGTNPHPQAVGGTNPHPQAAIISYYSVAVSVIRTALGL